MWQSCRPSNECKQFFSFLQRDSVDPSGEIIVYFNSWCAAYFFLDNFLTAAITISSVSIILQNLIKTGIGSTHPKSGHVFQDSTLRTQQAKLKLLPKRLELKINKHKQLRMDNIYNY